MATKHFEPWWMTEIEMAGQHQRSRGIKRNVNAGRRKDSTIPGQSLPDAMTKCTRSKKTT